MSHILVGIKIMALSIVFARGGTARGGEEKKDTGGARESMI